MEGASPRTDKEEEIEGEIHYSDEEEISHHTSGEKKYNAEEGNTEGEEIEGEIRYSDEEEGSYHTCEEDEYNHNSDKEETEPPENSTVSPLQEDQLAQILANMSDYVQPHSPLDLNIDINQL